MAEKNLSCVDAECPPDPRVESLAALLTAAEQAHAQWESDRTLVATDDGPEALIEEPYSDWQHWYAKYLLDNGIGLVVGTTSVERNSLRMQGVDMARSGVLGDFPGDTDCDALCGDSIALDG